MKKSKKNITMIEGCSPHLFLLQSVMNLEIERKFLVNDPSFLEGMEGTEYCQGYLAHYHDQSSKNLLSSSFSVKQGATIRVRTQGEKAVITIKGPPQGAERISRLEFEYPIPLEDAKTLLTLCKEPFIYKRRYRIEHEGSLWEVDRFSETNEGLVLAEIELPEETASFSTPPWLGEEVSQDPRYTNSYLVRFPYTTWKSF
jgi:adenylate cyclase